MCLGALRTIRREVCACMLLYVSLGTVHNPVKPGS